MTASSQSGSGASRAEGLLGAVSGDAGLTLVSRVLGFGRWIVQATTVGAGTVAGAYATANQVPNVLYEAEHWPPLSCLCWPRSRFLRAAEMPRGSPLACSASSWLC